VYSLRRQLLEGTIQFEDGESVTPHQYVTTVAEDVIDATFDTHLPADADTDEWDLEALRRDLAHVFGLEAADLDEVTAADHSRAELREAVGALVGREYDDKTAQIGADVLALPEEARVQLIGAERLPRVLDVPEEERARAAGRAVLEPIERSIMLQVLDQQWKDHLYSLDHLKEGIGLRGYGQRDPLVEYKKESFALFQSMRERVDEEILRYLWRLRPVITDGTGAPARPVPPMRRAAPVTENRPSVPAFAGAFRGAAPVAAGPPGAAPRPARVGGDDAPIRTVRREEPKVGRNDPCPCGSGKKYKKCHGAQ